ncbi:MAG TPA: hypothetical protein VMP08_21765 [Anaerolineae bacterium]|nr:hypothetical protein [Anaerolineae bacterium]
MKQKYVALKMYLVGMTVGLFILGWSVITHSDANAQANASTSSTASTVSAQTQSSTRQAFVTQPRIRTRTS